MSLAIGTWLYDASSDYSKDSRALNNAMLSAMSMRTNEYSEGNYNNVESKTDYSSKNSEKKSEKK